jgi:hypothetical protein
LRRSQVAAAERATVLSVRSLILQLAGALGAVAMGGLAVLTNTAAAFGVPAVVLAVPGWLLGTAANAEPTRADPNRCGTAIAACLNEDARPRNPGATRFAAAAAATTERAGPTT